MKRLLSMLMLVIAAFAFAPAAVAQTAPPDARDVDFEPMDPSKSRHKEDLSGIPFMVGAYMVIWAGLFGYLFVLQKKQGKVDDEIAALRKARRRAMEAEAGQVEGTQTP